MILEAEKSKTGGAASGEASLLLSLLVGSERPVGLWERGESQTEGWLT